MVLGAQTEKLTGSAVLFTSENLTDWTFLGAIAGGGLRRSRVIRLYVGMSRLVFS